MGSGMNTVLVLGLGFGALAGVAHAYGLLRARRGRPAVGNACLSAAYVALWTLGLWMLFGTYVLSLWLLATLVYAGTRVWQYCRAPAQ